jgi:hypothetical protein
MEATATLNGTASAETQLAATSSALQSTFTATATTTGTISSTPTTGSSGGVVATETLYARFFGTQPPAISYGKISLINKAKAEVYISLQCTTIEGGKSILEYPVHGRMRVSAPAGRYTYVAWAGGRQFQGFFGLGKNEEITITIYKDKVTIK